MVNQIWEMSAVEVHRLLKEKKLSAREVLESSISRIEEVDNKLNSLEILNNKCLWISKGKSYLEKKDLIQTTRIGISKAKNIKWRWYLKRSRSISKREKGDRNPNLKNSTNNLSGVT